MGRCARQLRVGPSGHPFALDFGAVMNVATATGADPAIVAELLPAAEAAILAGLNAEG